MVITIIVMLILAGVSLNALVGDNGIITQAQNAKVTSDKTSIIEEIETEFMRYNVDSVIDDDITDVDRIIKKLISKGIIDSAMESNGSFSSKPEELAVVFLTKDDGSWDGIFQYVVKKGEYVFNVFQNNDGTYTAENSDIVTGSEAGGGELSGGTVLVTKDTFTKADSEGISAEEKGKYIISSDANVLFANTLSGQYSIYVKSGVTATVSVFETMELTNKGVSRSAIDIEPGGTLNLWIREGKELIVNSR